MKFEMIPIKIVAALILGIAAFSFALSYIDRAASRCSELQAGSPDALVSRPCSMRETSRNLLEMNRPNSELMARLFQLMFILFFISPPVIALMLFLIWKELKKRNDLK